MFTFKRSGKILYNPVFVIHLFWTEHWCLRTQECIVHRQFKISLRKKVVLHIFIHLFILQIDHWNEYNEELKNISDTTERHSMCSPEDWPQTAALFIASHDWKQAKRAFTEEWRNEVEVRAVKHDVVMRVIELQVHETRRVNLTNVH